MNYGFSMSKFDIEKYVKQVSGALEKRAELISREKYPELWKKTDEMNSGKSPIEESRNEQRLRVRVAGVICLVLGVILVVPGLAKPQELLFALVMGVIGIVAGIRSFLRSGKNINLFNRPARQLLKHENKALSENIVTVGFFEDRMEIPAVSVKTGVMKNEIISYSDFEYFFETKDTFVMTYKEQVMVLQKQDLVAKTVEEFREFIRDKISYINLAENV